MISPPYIEFTRQYYEEGCGNPLYLKALGDKMLYIIKQLNRRSMKNNTQTYVLLTGEDFRRLCDNQKG